MTRMHEVLKISIFTIFFVILLLHQSFAKDIPVIVITASKKPQSLSTVGTSVTVLDEKFFKNNSEYFLGDALATTSTSANFFQSGGHGTASAIQLRGMPKRYSTVYIDGVKMSDPSSVSNDFDFNNILTSQVSRVEILKGNQSSIYGSGAIGGTIHITTKKGEPGFNKDVNYTTGSHGTHNLSTSLSGSAIDFGTVTEGNYIIRPITIIITDSIVSTDTITLTNHGFSTGDSLIYDYPASALSSYSGSVAQNTELYVIKIDNDTFKFAESEANALAGTQTTIYPEAATNYFFRLTNSINRDRGSFLNTGSFSEYHVGILNTGETTRLYKLVSEDKIIVSLSSINQTNDTINISGHGLNTGDKLLYMRAWVNGNSIQYGGSNILDGQTIYYAIRVDADNIKLATSLAYAQAGTNLDLSVKETSNDDNFGFLRLNNDLNQMLLLCF